MFDFLMDMGNHDERKVARWPDSPEEWVVDTCRVSDSQCPFETAIKHEKYNGGEMVIIEEYDDKESAQVGHDKWVKIMSADELPESLVDVSTCGIAQLCDVFDSDFRQNEKKDTEDLDN